MIKNINISFNNLSNKLGNLSVYPCIYIMQCCWNYYGALSLWNSLWLYLLYWVSFLRVFHFDLICLHIDPIIDVENGILGETKPRRRDRRRQAISCKKFTQKLTSFWHICYIAADNSPQHQTEKSPSRVIMRKGKVRRHSSTKKRFSINGHVYNYKVRSD